MSDDMHKVSKQSVEVPRIYVDDDVTSEEFAQILARTPRLELTDEQVREIVTHVDTCLAWSVDVHDHWDDTPIILKAADELP